MSIDDAKASGESLAWLVEAVRERVLALPGDDRGDYVGSALSAVNRVLRRVQAEGLASGQLFCEWGSGVGGVCVVAALNGFTPIGIEIQGELVEAARSMVKDPGDEDLAAATSHMRLSFDCRAWDALGVGPEDCHVVFAYPWPGEEACVDGVFRRHAAPGALLLTFHDWERVLVQRKLADKEKLLSLGWM
jgi:hypothetical protein